MTVVLLHPVGLDAACWQFLDFGPFEAPEFPGHGSRPRPQSSWTLDGAADEVVLNVGGVLDVVGCSMGGMVAQHIAFRHPSRVRSLLLACTNGAARKALMLQRAEAASAGGMEAVLNSTLQRWFTAAALAQPDHPGVAYARQRLLTDDPVAFAQTWRAMADHNTLEHLGQIQVPVTVIAGSQDASASVEVVSELHRRLPHSRLEVLEGPHMLQLETPHEFSDAIRRHLEWAGA